MLCSRRIKLVGIIATARNKIKPTIEKANIFIEMRQVVIYPGEDGYWVAECPSLPGCISQGKTKEEAISNISEAIRGYIAALQEDNLPVPEERFETFVVEV